MKYRINLLSVSKISITDRIIHFALNYLRYILVITQIVVIGVFFYRFKVDQEIVDLKEALDQKREIIKVSQPLIESGQNISLRMNQVKNILSNQDTFLGSIDYILSRFPEDFFLNKFTLKDKEITMDGYTANLIAIKNFYLRMKQEKKFKQVELKSVKKSTLGHEFSFEFVEYHL
ncbi:PilN domain-containing protein [Candidatus Roizmanbacteria bacterium]|nr:PilN domain-containing protein [Candidatus Roizmanbacteria bacterium]